MDFFIFVKIFSVNLALSGVAFEIILMDIELLATSSFKIRQINCFLIIISFQNLLWFVRNCIKLIKSDRNNFGRTIRISPIITSKCLIGKSLNSHIHEIRFHQEVPFTYFSKWQRVHLRSPDKGRRRRNFNLFINSRKIILRALIKSRNFLTTTNSQM